MPKTSDLPDLPDSGSDFWEGADVNINTPEIVNDGPHYFHRVRGNEAYCAHCGWGFMLDMGDKVKSGHVFDYEDHIVI